MINVYLDPPSYSYLSNELFRENSPHNRDNCLLVWRYLKDYCQKNGINLNTIDFWKKNKISKDDIFVSIDHKNFLRKVYWKIKNKKYPILTLDNFRKKILFHLETPLFTPDVYFNSKKLLKIYDRIFFSSKLDNPEFKYIPIPRVYNNIIDHLWQNAERKFLTMLHFNKKLPLEYKLFYKFQFPKSLAKRIEIINFFGKKGEIDLYGFDWDKPLPFPYRSFGKIIKKVYKGAVNSKYLTLSQYHFAICIDSYWTRGFIGHGIFDSFFVGTVPIYLGAPDIEEYVPKNCFIDMRDFKNYTDLGQFLKSLSEAKIKEYRENARKYLESEQYKPFTKEYFAKLFVEAVTN
jgi:hypothetical protein